VSEIFYGENGRIIGINSIPEDDLNLKMIIDECINLAVVHIQEFNDSLVDCTKIIMYQDDATSIPTVKFIVREK